jgi:hypothetical protein
VVHLDGDSHWAEVSGFIHDVSNEYMLSLCCSITPRLGALSFVTKEGFCGNTGSCATKLCWRFGVYMKTFEAE